MVPSDGVLVAPSLLAADFMCLGTEIQSVIEAGAYWLHLDIMDGVFVPPISFGSQIVAQVRNFFPDLFLDVHLMLDDPEKHLSSFVDAGASAITLHVETCRHIHRFIMHLKKCEVLAGISLIPSTPVALLRNILEYVDLVLVMTVNPGYGGQDFIPSCAQKIVELYDIRSKEQLKFKIAVDGGVNLDNAKLLCGFGADILVVGTSIFKEQNRKEIIDKLKNGYTFF